MSFKVFEEHTLEENRQMTADYFLDGALMIAKNQPDTTTYKLLLGLSEEFRVLEEQINATANEGFVQEFTESTLERWESDLGIPDGVFDVTGDLEERRTNIIIKLVSLGVQTAEDFENLGNLLGYDNIDVKAGADVMVFPLLFPFMFSPSGKSAKHTIIVDLPTTLNNVVFPMTFPTEFSSNPFGKLENLFNKLKPSNCQVIFRYVL